MNAHSHAHTHDHDDHLEHGAPEHAFGFPYWHFLDFGTHALRAAAKPITRAIPVAMKLARALPVVGLIGETAHVYTPFQKARADWHAGHLTNAKFAGLSAGYALYALSGLLGGASVVVKEGLTYGVQGLDVLDEAYVPHSIYSELQHTGLVKNLPNMQGALKQYCTKCGGFHVGHAHPGEERAAPFLAMQAKNAREHNQHH